MGRRGGPGLTGGSGSCLHVCVPGARSLARGEGEGGAGPASPSARISAEQRRRQAACGRERAVMSRARTSE